MSDGLIDFYCDVIEQWPLIVLGIWATVKLTFIVSITGFLLAVVVFFLGLTSRVWVLRCVHVYKEFFIGTPLICIIYILYYGLPQLGLRPTPFSVLVVAFTLNIAAYNSGYMLSVYNGLEKKQVEAARAQGFSEIQVYLSIILPQVVRFSMPSLINQAIYNLKDSSIAFLVQYPEFFARMQEVAAGNFQFLKVYSLTAVVYIVIAAFFYLTLHSIGRQSRLALN